MKDLEKKHSDLKEKIDTYKEEMKEKITQFKSLVNLGIFGIPKGKFGQQMGKFYQTKSSNQGYNLNSWLGKHCHLTYRGNGFQHHVHRRPALLARRTSPPADRQLTRAACSPHFGPTTRINQCSRVLSCR